MWIERKLMASFVLFVYFIVKCTGYNCSAKKKSSKLFFPSVDSLFHQFIVEASFSLSLEGNNAGKMWNLNKVIFLFDAVGWRIPLLNKVKVKLQLSILNIFSELLKSHNVFSPHGSLEAQNKINENRSRRRAQMVNL